MRVYAVEYDFNLVTVHGEVKTPDHRVELFHDVTEFINRVKHLEGADNDINLMAGVRPNTNIKTYSGELTQIPVGRVLDPLSV